MTPFATALRHHRTAAGLTQQQAAELVSRTDWRIWSHWECGRRMPSVENLARIVKVLDLGPKRTRALVMAALGEGEG